MSLIFKHIINNGGIYINLYFTVTVLSVSITPPNPSGVAGSDDVTLTCTGTLSGSDIARV